MGSTPRITVGMPVFNGAATIGASIEALLGQTWTDFELVVADNASADETGEIVRALAARDARIRYVRHPVNLGAGANYSFLAETARGEYLKWASASDWCAPTLLARCLEALERDPDAVLAAARTRLFEGDPSNARDYPDDVEILDATPAARLQRLNRTMRLNNAMNGLIRISALRRTRLIGPYQQADLVMMGHLALLGKFLLLDEPLFYRRMEPEASTALQTAEEIRRFHYPRPSAAQLFQHWKRHAGWLHAALSAPMRGKDRVLVLERLARGMLEDWRELASDLTGAWRYATRRPGS